MPSCRFRTQTEASWNWNCNAIRSDNPTRPNKSSQKQGWGGSRVGVRTNSRHLLRSQRAAGVQTCTKCHFMSASAPREVSFFFFFTSHADCSKCLTGEKGRRPRMTASQETQTLVVWIPGSLTQSSLMITSLMEILRCVFSIWHHRLKSAISWPWETRCRRPHVGELYQAKPPGGLFPNKNLHPPLMRHHRHVKTRRGRSQST